MRDELTKKILFIEKPRPSRRSLVQATSRVTSLDNDTIMEVENLLIRFGHLTVVNDISFNIIRNEIFGFLGPNRVGKITTIHSITTIQRPTSGRVSIGGHDTSKEYLEVRKLIGIAQ